jgi:plastocyanin
MKQAALQLVEPARETLILGTGFRPEFQGDPGGTDWRQDIASDQTSDTMSIPPSQIRRFAEELMSRTHFLITACLSIGVAIAMPAGAQSVVSGAPVPHVIVISLVQRSGPMPFAFEPANFTAQRGDTLRFVQASAAMHNVRFVTQPKGANLGKAAVSRYLSAKGDAVTIVVDSRFTEGKYEIVCDPHGAIGMHGFLTVK